MTLAEVLDRVAVLVASGRCVRAAARDGDGNIVAVLSPRASCFCPAGAAMRVTRGVRNGDELYQAAFDRMDDYARGQRATCLAVWNDATPHESVVAAIRELADMERAEERERVSA